MTAPSDYQLLASLIRARAQSDDLMDVLRALPPDATMPVEIFRTGHQSLSRLLAAVEEISAGQHEMHIVLNQAIALACVTPARQAGRRRDGLAGARALVGDHCRRAHWPGRPAPHATRPIVRPCGAWSASGGGSETPRPSSISTRSNRRGNRAPGSWASGEGTWTSVRPRRAWSLAPPEGLP